jgi:hypothetical protein
MNPALQSLRLIKRPSMRATLPSATSAPPSSKRKPSVQHGSAQTVPRAAVVDRARCHYVRRHHPSLSLYASSALFLETETLDDHDLMVTERAARTHTDAWPQHRR